jgi:glycosyltransferase involved in cell wall biosynthesis
VTSPGVSVVVPVCDGARWLRETLQAIDSQRDGRPFEIIAVDDGSRDGSRRILEEAQEAGRLTLLDGPGRGIAAAINTGVRAAAQPLIAQVDQDVRLDPGWLATLADAFGDPEVAAAQGRYTTSAADPFWARVMGRDLEARYEAIRGLAVDHVCTGNTVYRATALHQVGLLDEGLGYGSDNDLSYRLIAAGHRLVFCPTATSHHAWRASLRGYLRQQYGVGYGRLDVVARHPRRSGGDAVSGALMMAHAPAMLLALVAAVVALPLALAGGDPRVPAALSLGLIGVLFAERSMAGVRAWRRTHDPAALAFGPAHLLRDVAWAWAICRWAWRRVTRAAALPVHSMARRPTALARLPRADPAHLGVLTVVPAYNEALSLGDVVGELRRVCPSLPILVVDDGSTDDTALLLPRLGVRWLSLPQRLGVGGAVRAGLRYAAARGVDVVVRVDGDGQHRACDIGRLLAPVAADRLDVVIGSRYLDRPLGRPGLRRWMQRTLAACLTIWTGQRITDPTSGFWCFGPRAVDLLRHHHPTGYPEPELLLLLVRNRLRVGEVPVRVRPRRAGRTSLTPARAGVAFARTLLALVLVPVRRIVRSD